MTRQEFESELRKTAPDGCVPAAVKDSDYRIIEKVYAFHPAISETGGKQQIAYLYTSFGMGVIRDMLPRANAMIKKEAELRNATNTLKRIQNEIRDIRNGEEI